MKAPVAACGCLLALAALSSQPAAATKFLAFGDSITQGYGDDPARAEKGYPPRLQAMLQAQNISATVENHGLGGETTGEALSRIDGVLEGGGDVLLLMEGTNDIGQRVSIETIRFNLAEMAHRAADHLISTVHASIIPRLPTANTDGSNQTTAALAVAMRELSWENNRDLADPFEAFVATPNAFATLYGGNGDNLHPNAAGYDLLALTFFDVLVNIDTVPPVLGRVSPPDGAEEVPADASITIDLYDFGDGINLAKTQLLLNGSAVAAVLRGDNRKLTLTYTPPAPLRGVVTLSVQTEDLATPPNAITRTASTFVIAGTTFLAGDVNRDGRVDGADLVLFGLHFGSRKGEGRYRSIADLNGDDTIDGLDLAILAANFGQSSF